MLELIYNDNNYADFIKTCARLFNTKADSNHLIIPENYGNGYLQAFMLPEGISVLVEDTVFKDDLYLQRSVSPNHQFFILQFNEAFPAEEHVLKQIAMPDVPSVRHNMVLFTNSYIQAKFLLPAYTKVRSVKLIFDKQHLLNLMSQEVTDKFLAGYYSTFFKKVSTDPIDADYRVLIDELLKPNEGHPLKLAFIQNRVLLLLEKFLINFMGKLHHDESSVKLKDEEISRLIKVESLLVKDYSAPPPTIAELSKISSMSPTKLKKDFKSMYGLPLYEYYQKNRMMRAKTLLMEGHCAIKEAGMMVGYTNLGHFAASFKKEFGILPSELFNAGKNEGFIPENTQGPVPANE